MTDAPPPPTVVGTPSDPRPAAALREAGRRFDDVVALDGVDLTVMSGSIVGLIGPSGAGKTTAVRLLTGSLRPTSGSAEVLGGDPASLSAGARARIGFMPQHVSLYDDLTVAENLDFVGSLYGLLWRRRRRRIRELLDWLELAPARSRRAGALSGGMRRRLQLAAAFVHDPALAFLDEPTAGIDPLVRRAIWAELRHLRDAGRTLLVTTQYVSEAEECDTVALVAEGRLVAFDTPDALRRRAFGGQLLEVETSGPVDAGRLEAFGIVDDVRQVGSRQLIVASPDAARATPQVITAVEAQGATVTSIRDMRPSFDEVFARLVDAARATDSAAGREPAPRAAA